MKAIERILVVTFLISNMVLCVPNLVSAQSKEELAIKKCEDKIALAEKKVDNIKDQIAVQDSIIAASKLEKKSVLIELDDKDDELDQLEKDYNAEIKELSKSKSKASVEEKREISKVEKEKLSEKTQKNTQINKDYAALNKRIAKAQSLETKALQKKKALSPSLKQAEAALKAAQKELAAKQKTKKK